MPKQTHHRIKQLVLISLIAFYTSFSFNLLAQDDAKIDSLKNTYQSAKDIPVRIDVLNELAVEYKKSDISKSLEYALQAIELSTQYHYPIGLCDGLYNKAWVKVAQNELSESLTIANELIDLSRSHQYYRGLGNGYNLLGNISFYKSEFIRAQNYYDSSGTYFKRLEDRNKLSISYHNIGLTHQIIGQDSLALVYYDSVLFNETNPNTRIASSSIQGMGHIFISRGQHPKALEYFFDALEISKTIDDPSEIASCLKSIGLVYIELGEFSHAINHFKEAFTILYKIGHTAEIGITHNYLGELFSELNLLDSSLHHHNKGLEIALTASNNYEMGRSYFGIGKAQLHTNNGQSLEFLKKAEEEFYAIGSHQKLAETYLMLGELHKQKNELSRALAYYEKASKIGHDISSPGLRAESAKKLAQIMIVQGDTQEALNNMVIYNELRDSIQALNEEKIAHYLEYEYAALKEKDSLQLVQFKKEAQFQNETEKIRASQRLTLTFLIFSTCLIIVLLIFHITRRKNQKRLEAYNKTISHQKERISTILETVKEGILETNALGTILYANKNASNILDRKSEHLIGLKLEDLFVLPDSNQKAAFLKSSTNSSHLHLKYNHPDTSVRSISLSVSPIQFEKKTISFSDVTKAEDLEIRGRWKHIRNHELERKKIAYDLHEGVAQKLFIAAFNISQIKIPENSGSIIANSKLLIGDLIEEVKNLAKSISPPNIYFGIPEAVDHLIMSIDDYPRTPEVSFDHNLGEHRFEPSFELSVFRIVQELLFNGLQHASASKLSVSIKVTYTNSLIIRYCDDGTGFELHEYSDSPGGLQNIKDRVKVFKGTIIIDSRINKGTIIDINYADILMMVPN